MPWVRGESLHEDIRSAFFDFSYQKRRLPIVNFNLVHVNSSNSSTNCQKLSFGTIIEASRDLFCLELPFDLDFMRLFNKVPLIEDAVFARNNDSIGKGTHSWGYDWSHERFKQNPPLLLISLDLFEKGRLQQSNPCFVIHHDKVIAGKTFRIKIFIIRYSTVLRLLIVVFLAVWKRNCVNST